MNELRTMHLFAGIGGGLLADLILGHRPLVAVEWDKYACRVLRERAADGWFPELSVWEGDVRLFDPSEYAGRVDCIHAGFPCQDISVAGKQAGLGEGTRSGLYREVLRIAGVVRPRLMFLENVSAILSNGLGGAYSETWPRWGMTVDGSAFVHPMSAHRMGAIDGSVSQYATPNTMDILPSRSYEAMKRQATNGGRKNRSRPSNLREQIDPLMCQAYDDAKAEANSDQVSNMQIWPTPSATDYKGAGKTGTLRDRLDYAVERGATKSKEFFGTPTAGGGTKGRSEKFREGKTPNPAEIAQSLGGRLNPKWVAWLMMFPIEWGCLKD